MELHNERRGAITLLDSIGVCSSSESTGGHSFRDCLQSDERPPLCPAIEPRQQRPAADDNRPTKAEADLPASESLPSDEISAADVAATDEAEKEEQPAVEQALPLAQPQLANLTDVVVPSPEGEAVLDAENSIKPASESHDGITLSLIDATTNQVAAGDAQAEAALNASVPLTETPSTEEPTAPAKSERRATAAGASESSGDAVETEAVQRSSKAGVPKPRKPEYSGVLDPPAVAPLDPPQTEEVNRTSANEAVSLPAVSEGTVVAAAMDAVGATPTVETSTTAAQTTVPNALPGVAATSKPPAAFVKTASGSEEAALRAGEVDPAKFLQRVVKAFESAHQRDGEVRLRLHPAELGALSIEVKVQDNVLTARVQAETLEARATIVDDLQALRERLAEQGIRIERFDVDLMDHSDHRQQSLDEQNRQREARQAAALRNPGRLTNSTGPIHAPTTRQLSAVPGGLNVII